MPLHNAGSAKLQTDYLNSGLSPSLISNMGHWNKEFLFYFFSAVLQKFQRAHLKTGLLTGEQTPWFALTPVASTDNPSNKGTAARTSPPCLQHFHRTSARGTDVARD